MTDRLGFPGISRPQTWLMSEQPTAELPAVEGPKSRRHLGFQLTQGHALLAYFAVNSA